MYSYFYLLILSVVLGAVADFNNIVTNNVCQESELPKATGVSSLILTISFIKYKNIGIVKGFASSDIALTKNKQSFFVPLRTVLSLK